LLSLNLAFSSPQVAACNDAANATATATLTAVANLTWYIYGYQITSNGATVASGGVNATITNLLGAATMNISVAAGVLGTEDEKIVMFPVPIPASGVNTAVVISIPAIGTGNTHASCALFGELR